MIKRALGLLARWFFSLLGLFVVASMIWVLAYRLLPVPMTWLMARDSLSGKSVQHVWVPLTAMSRSLPRAVIGAEDANFCYHSGFDWEAMKAAARANYQGKTLRGGSTISQQAAKNVFLWPQRSYVRKGLEAWFTALIEIVWGKARIMEVYLNVVEMGPGIYGMASASQHYFGTTVDRLSPKQAARLTAILPQPIKRSVAKPSKTVRRYARRIEKRVAVVADERIDACLRN